MAIRCGRARHSRARRGWCASSSRARGAGTPAGALAADLERYVGDFPINDGPRPMLRMMLAARRNREAAATLVILAVALTVFAGFVQQLELRRQMLMSEVEAAEQHRVEAVAAEASAVAAQRTAEAARLNAESAQADAEAEAVHALVQQSAEQPAAAERARRPGRAVNCEQLAATEIRARQDLEQEATLAHAARLGTSSASRPWPPWPSLNRSGACRSPGAGGRCRTAGAGAALG